MSDLGVSLPSLQPKATEYISEMVEMIKVLIEKTCLFIKW